MSCSCDKPAGSVLAIVRLVFWRGLVVAALLASPDVRRLRTSLTTQAMQWIVSQLAMVQTRQIEDAEQEARRVAARREHLEEMRRFADSADRDDIDRELADLTAAATALKVAIGEGVRGLGSIREIAEGIGNQIARSRGYEPLDRNAQIARVREAREAEQLAAQREAEARAANARLEAEARLANERAARLEAEAEETAASARRASEALAESRREADRSRAEAATLRSALAARRATASCQDPAVDNGADAACRHAADTPVPSAKTASQRVVTRSYRVRTQPAE